MTRLWLVAALALMLAVPGAAAAQIPVLPTSTPTPTPTAAGPAPLSDPPVVDPGGPGDATTHAGADATRRGWIAANGLRAPLRPLWRADVGAFAGRPIVGGERVFVPVGRHLEALDLRSGRRLWKAGLIAERMAYADGVVVVSGNELVALDAATGTRLWAVENQGFDGDPLIAGDLAIVQGQGLYAYDLRTGAMRWRGGTGDGTDGAPSASGDRVYQYGGCTVVAVDRRDGRILWKRDRGCTGGGGGRAVLHRARVYTDSGSELPPLAASDGKRLDGPPADLIAGDFALDYDGDLRAFDLRTGAALWSRSEPPFQNFGEPLAIGASFFRAAAQGVVQAITPRTGALRWSATLRAARGNTRSSYGAFLAAGHGVLIVARGSTVDALVGDRRPGRRIAVRASSPLIVAGARFRLTSRARGDLLPTLRLAADPFPFGRFSPTGPTDLPYQHRYQLTARPTINTRIRVISPGTRDRSRTFTVFALPRVRYRFRNDGTTVTARVIVRGDRSVRLRGRTAFLYLADAADRRLKRLGSGVLSGPHAGKGVAGIRFPVQRGVGKRDFLFTCVPRIERIGQGARTSVQRRCGAASIDY